MNRIFQLLTWIILFVVSMPVLQAQSRLALKLVDAENFKPLPVCNVVIKTPSSEQLIITNEQGNAECILKQNNIKVSIQISFIGYETYRNSFLLSADTLLSIALTPKVVSIADVDVYSDRIRRDGMNIHYFSPKEASLDVSLIGEKDIIRHVQDLPGISQGMEGTLGMFVRGGNNGNNRVEIDGVPVYASSHLFGLFSIFQAEVVQGVAFKMGGIPAQDGNFLSSVTYVETKNTLLTNNENSLSLSPYLLGGSALIPFKNKKIALLVGGRYSLLRTEYKAIKALTNAEGDINPQVMDGFVKLGWMVDSLNTVNFELLATNDYLGYNNESEIILNWYNTIATINWDRRTNKNRHWHTTAYINRSFNIQRQKTYEDGDLINGLMLQSGLDEWALKTVCNFKLNNLDCFAGADLQYTAFKPGSEKVVVSANTEETSYENLSSVNISPYFGGKYQFSNHLTINGGIRTYFYVSGEYFKIKADPRLLVNYNFSNQSGIELSYDHFSQLYHELEGLPTGWSLNMLVPADKNLPIEGCHQIYAGFFKLLGKYHFNLGGYYKKMHNLASYINNENLFGVHDATWEDDIDSGTGQSYGLETYIKRKAERWNWSVAYTLSKTNRHFPNINNGETYPFKFDRRHILNAQMDYLLVQKEKKWQKAFLSFIYSSGHKMTIQTGTYLGITPPYWSQREGGIYVPSEMNSQAYYRQLMSSKNGYTLPAYIRLDMGYTFYKQKPKYSREFNISVFNVLNRKNPYLYYYKDDQWYALSLFPIMPSIRWSVSF